MDSVTAKAIVESLRRGIADQDHIRQYTADSRLERSPLREMRDHLKDVGQGISMIRFINGAYGEGKSHTLALLRQIALDKDFVVSEFPLETQGVRFDMFDRVLRKMIEVLATPDFRAPKDNKTVLELVIQKWAKQAEDIDDALDGMGLHPSMIDLRSAISLYGKILVGKEVRHTGGKDRLILLRHWFAPEPTKMRTADRRMIGVLNNVTPQNAGAVIEGLAVFFRGIGYRGWLVLIDEQEIVPTLMTPLQRKKCNENLRILVDTLNIQEPRRGFYYVFASAPEFFTDQERGVNAYPALKDRITNAVLPLTGMDADEMFEVAQRIQEIYRDTGEYPDRKQIVSDEDIRSFVEEIESRFGSVRYKARGFVQSFVSFIEERLGRPDALLTDLIDEVLGRTFGNIGAALSAAHKK